MNIPKLAGDPRNREELKDWLEWRERLQPGVPLTSREYLMIKQLQTKRPPYSIT